MAREVKFIEFRDSDKKAYERLRIASSDLRLAQYCLSTILKKGWHYQPWQRRWTVYRQQTTYTTALVVAYVRPFTRSKGWPKLPVEVSEVFDAEETRLHEQLKDLRATLYAHSDSKNYSVSPWRSATFVGELLTEPSFRISDADARALNRMIDKLKVDIERRIKNLIPGELPT
jgi:hypothetical protein